MDTNAELSHLIEQWNRHEDLRRKKAPVGELAASRAELDRLRLNVRREAISR